MSGDVAQTFRAIDPLMLGAVHGVGEGPKKYKAPPPPKAPPAPQALPEADPNEPRTKMMARRRAAQQSQQGSAGTILSDSASSQKLGG